MQVLIMRGPAGAGKDRWIARRVLAMLGELGAERAVSQADRLKAKIIVCSADDGHITHDGSYNYDPLRAGEAHKQCLLKFERFVHNVDYADHTIIVNNTNTTAWEIAPYYQLALAAGADTKIIRIHATLAACVARNVHNVPPTTVDLMFRNILTEKLPGHWKEEIVFA